MKKQIYYFVFSLLVFTSVQAQTLQLLDHAGLKLQLESNGTISAVELNGSTLPNGSMGGFYSRDPLNATKVPLTGTVSTISAGKFQLNLTNSLNDSVTAVITEGAGFIEVTGELKDLTGTDRGLWLGFNLPVNTIGWTWGHHLNTANLVVTGAASGYSGDDRLLIPIPAVWRTNGGIALCIPPTDPCVFENSADASGLRIQMAYGLSPLTTQFPSKAPFRFRIYTIDGTWGFRDALAKYYDWYPDYYSIEPSAMKRLNHRRDWLTMNYENMAPSKNDMAGLASPELGQYCAYTKITARPAGMTGVETLLATDTQGYLNAIANCTDIMHYDRKLQDSSLVNGRLAISNCVAYHPDGTWSMQMGPAAGTLDIGHNVSPYLFKDAAHPNFQIFGDMYLRRPAKLLGLDPNFTFIHWDVMGGRSTIVNYRREHFAYTQHPLTFDQSGRLCLPTLFTNYELFNIFRLQANQGGFFHEGAGMQSFKIKTTTELLGGQNRMGMFFMSSLMQSGWNEDGDKYHDLTTYDERRIYMGRKAFRVGFGPASNYTTNTTPYIDIVKRTMADAIAYGLTCEAPDNYFYPTNFTYYDPINSLFSTPVHQALWNNYIPASEAIRLAGWEPVTYAYSNPSDSVAINRFGRGDTIYMTVWGPNPPPSVEIEVDSAGLELTNNPAFSEILSNTQITVTKSTKGWKLAFSMEQYMTRVLKILRNGSQTAIIEHQMNNANDVQIYPNPTKSFINLKSSHEIKSVEVCDLSGKLIMKTINPKNSVDLSSVQKGMYFLKISLDNGVILDKIIKE